jgi:hypothetical protein
VGGEARSTVGLGLREREKATLLEPAGATATEKKVLVSSVRVLDPDNLIRNFAMQVA